MPRIRTDDGPRSLRGVWLGPKGFTWPMEWTFERWAFTFLAAVTILPVTVAVFWILTRAVLFAPLAGLIVGLPAAALVGARVTAGLSMDTPIRYRAAVAWHTLTLARRPALTPTRFTIPQETPRGEK